MSCIDSPPKDWARQALGGGIKSFLAGRFRFLRSPVATAKLERFLKQPPE